MVLTSALFLPLCIIIFRIPCYMLHKHKLGVFYQEISSFQLKNRAGIPIMTLEYKSCFLFRFYNNKRTNRLSLLAAIFRYVETGCLSTLFANLRRIYVNFEVLFSLCIILIACRCLHGHARFITFKQLTKFNGDL